MRFGVSISHLDEVDFVVDAEAWGYDFCWATDSQLLRSNPWVLLALAATRTSRIRLGTGLAVAGLRLAPVLANAIATVNKLAPGRTFLGLATGNTAMRTMGQRPMAIGPFREYVRVVQALLRGEEVDYTLGGRTAPIRFQNQDLGYVDVEHPIPLHLGGLGPKAQTLAGEVADGLVTSLPRGGTVPEVVGRLREGAARSGRSLDGFELTALANLLLLEPGETLESERAIAECGSAVMANVHYLVDLHLETGAEPPAYILPIWEEYLAFHSQRAARHRQQQMHQSHYTHLDPDEARFVTPEMIRNFCIAGQPGDIVEQLRALEAQGLNSITFILPLDRFRRTSEVFARTVMPSV